MSYVTITFLYPLLLGALSVGVGLLVDRCCGEIPAPLVPIAGFGLLVVVTQFLVIRGATAPATPWVLVALALLGGVLGRRRIRSRWRTRARGDVFPALVPVLTYLVIASPLIIAARLTFPGYLLDTTAGVHIATANYIIHHGMQFPAPYTAYGAMLHVYDGSGYPDGGQVLFAATSHLTGVDLVWMYFPFQVFAVALTGLGLYFIAGQAGMPRWAAAVCGWISSVSAIVTAYTMMGSIKELTALPLLIMLGAYTVLAGRREQVRLRDVVPFAIGSGGSVAAIGPAAAPWILALAVGTIAIRLGRRLLARQGDRSWSLPRARELSHAAVLIAAAVFVGVVLIIPTIIKLQSALTTANSLSGSDSAQASDPGNLLGPLRFVQVVGIWLGIDHRLPPEYLVQTYLLIGVAFIGLAAGIWYLILRRRVSHLAWLALSLLIWLALYERGTEWTDAKVLMLTSPVIVLVALVGALGEASRRRVMGGVVAVVIVGGVLASDALLYHGTTLAPTGRFEEAAAIGKRFSGQGPTLITDFDEYTFSTLANLRVDGPAFAPDMHGPFTINGDLGVGYGLSYDTDNVATDVQRFRLIVMRRSARWSRPPGNYRLAYLGSWYEVWKRVGRAPRVHVSLGSSDDPFGTATDPYGRARCPLVHRLAREAARDHARLRVAAGPVPDMGAFSKMSESPSVVRTTNAAGGPELAFTGPGEIQSAIRVPRGGDYQLWLGGNVGNRTMTAYIDNHLVGTERDDVAGEGNMAEVADVHLSAGRHTVRVVRGGGGLAPGDDSPTFIDGIYLTRGINTSERLGVVSPSRWRSLCGRELDWIEIT